jgi:hypothetical protein
VDSAPEKTSKSDRFRTRGAVFALVVTLLPLVYFLPATCDHLILSPDDGVIQNIPFRVAIANQIHAGSVPLWNPSIFCGMPLLGAAQAGVLFPLNWFYLLFHPPAATNLMMLSGYMVAALGAYLYARRSGSSEAGAGLTSLVWQASAFLVAQVGHTNIVHTAALLPWLFWAIEGYGQTGERRRGLLLAGLVALQCFAGHQQTFVYSLLVATAYAGVLWRSRRARTYLWSLLLIGAGVGLAAVQILPTLELLQESLRAEASYDFFSSFSMPPGFLWTFFAPYVMGGGDGNLFRAPYVGPSYYAEYVGYVGLATLALGWLAVRFKPDARTIFWAVIAPLGVLLALGRYAPFEFYRLIYSVPILNLFRVPARHLMEVEFALACLAGRGFTALETAPDRKTIVRWIVALGALVFLLSALAITLGRPENFHLARNAPATILRAPELFLPPAIALLSAGALWLATKRRGIATTLLMLAVLYLDLNLWGQFSGWRVSSPSAMSELWREPAALRYLRERDPPNTPTPYRILTQDHFFDPNEPVSYAAPVSVWLLSLQADIPMMWGWENAAGYEGFGIARYSQLAGDMKVWGDLTDPERTLRSESRELDLLNVRYLLVRSPAAPKNNYNFAAAPAIAAFETYGGQKFTREVFDSPALVAGQRLAFEVPATPTKRFALTTVLAWSADAPDGSLVARVKLQAADGQSFGFDLRAGEHTSEWAYDRADIRAQIRHRRAPIATSYTVVEADPKYAAHDYACWFELPARTEIVGGEITVSAVPEAPRLSLKIGRISLINDDQVLPVRKEWIALDSSPPQAPATPVPEAEPRWKRFADVGPVAIFENQRTMPRAWLVNGERIVSGPQQLQIIRSGKISTETVWDPATEALVENSTGIAFGKEKSPPGRVEIRILEPNRVTVATDAAAPSLLVLADNYYPGWRAEVDGTPAAIQRVNYNQRGVAVGAGSQIVTFTFQPNSFRLGSLISIVSLILLLGWMMIRRRRPTP